MVGAYPIWLELPEAATALLSSRTFTRVSEGLFSSLF